MKKMVCALGLLAGCPSDVTAPVIESFAVSSPIVANGATVVLSWKVADATKISIVADPGGSVIEAENLAGMATSSPITAVTAFVLTATGEDNLTTQKTLVVRPMDAAEVAITAFGVSPEAIPLGDSAELAWTVVNATEIAIQDQDGTSIYQGADATGTQTVSPLETAAYTITARGPSGTASETALLTVNPPGSGRVVSFAAQPTSISIGGSATLSWTVENAPEGIEIRAAGTTIATDANLTGSVAVSPLVTTDYTLIALNPIGDGRDTVTVTVAPSPPVIVDFDAAPNPTAIGGMTTLQWGVLGATRIRVLEGAVVHLDTMVDPSTYDVPVDEAMETFTLEASNANGTVTDTVDVVGDAAPVIERFQSDILGFIDTATVTLSWDVTGAVTIDLTPFGSFAGTSTGVTVFITDTTVFELVANNNLAQARATLTVAKQQIEVEPNDTAATANVLTDTFNFITGGTGNGDVDFFAVDVPAGGFVFAATPPDLPPCTPGEIRLFDQDGVSFRGGVGPGPDGCSIMNPVFLPFARNLAGGRYYVSFFGLGPPSPYNLIIQTGGPGCGNGIREISEGCDDGNLAGADGCSAACVPEPLGSVTGPVGAMTFLGSILTFGGVDLYEVEMTAAGYIVAETFVPSAPSCPLGPNGDTVLELQSSTFQLLASDDEGGVGSCSRLVQEVGIGTYYVAVRHFDPAQGLPAYEVRIAAVDFGCGNGVLEAGEGCDDGNMANNDGCSSACVFEGIPETEPNDAFDDIGVPTINGSGAFSGAAVGFDVDYYAVVVPEGAHLSVELLVNGANICPAFGPASPRLELYGFFGAPLLYVANVEPPDLCPSIMPVAVTPATNMAAGTYFVAVSSPDPMGLPSYQLLIDVILPVCGNGIIDGTETCDDGNTAANDGCDASCALEIIATVTPPGQVVMIPAGPGYSTIAVDVTQPGQSISAMVVGACPPALQMGFLNPDGQLLGVGFNCVIPFPQLNPMDIFNIDLAPDTYFIRIAGAPGGADVDVRVIDPMCGDGARQQRAGEQCDDGGLVDGDGCDSSCLVEVDGVFSITAPGAQVLAGSIPPGMRDLYRIDVGPGGDFLVAIQTFVPDLASGCMPPDNDTVIELYDGVTLNQIAFNDDSPAAGGLCSLINQLTLEANMSYFLVVRPFGATIPAYEVRVTAGVANVCGNGFLEPAIGETCDDGNLAPGDGCDAACDLEPDGVFAINAPGAQLLAGTIPQGGRDVYRIDVGPGNGFLTTIQTFVPNVASGCLPPDNFVNMQVTDAMLQPIAGSMGPCSSILPPLSLSSNTSYFLFVEPPFGALPAYEVRVTAVLANICGNGITEAGNGESCDDGNVVSGDGCSDICVFEGVIVTESELNGTQATADLLGLNGAGVVIAAGAVNPQGDDDVFSFTVPPLQTVTFSARTHSDMADPMSCANFMTDTRIFLEPAGVEVMNPNMGELAYNDDIFFNMPPNPDIFCSEITGVPLDGGPMGATYFVRVQGFADNAQPTYFMTVTLQ